jgi:hypothetical protein
MQSRRFLLFVTVACACAAEIGSPSARAQLRVVVEDFRGPQGGSLRNSLVRNFQDEGGIEIIAREEASDTALELGILRRSYRPDDYVRLAQTLEVSAFVRGVVRRARRRWTLTVIVVSGSDGREVGRASWGGRTVAALGGIRRNGFARLEEHLSGGGSPGPAPPRVQQQTYTAQEGSAPWWAGDRRDDESPPIRDDDDDDDDDDDAEPVVGDARQTWLSAALVTGTLRRSMVATAEVASPRDQPASGSTVPEQRTYESGGIGHMELGVEAVVWPGAVGDEQKIPWFGAVGSYRHSLFLTSFGCQRRNDPADPCTAEIEVPTNQSELYLGARGRYRIGDGNQAPRLQADIGYGSLAFELDQAALRNLERPSILPPLVYSYVHLGIGGAYPFVPQWLTVGAHAAYRVGLGVGRAAQEVWGVQTTDTGGFLVGLEARSEAPYIAEGVYFGLTIDYFRFTTTYRGQTKCVDSGIDGQCYPGFAAPTPMGSVDPGESWEPWPHAPGAVEDVIGGIAQPVDDDYIRLSLAIGYALR